MAKVMVQNSAETDDRAFEASVLSAAKDQAARMLAQAKKDADAAYDALMSQPSGDPVATHETEGRAALRRKEAAARQDNLRKLLVYRKQLVNGLFAEAQEALAEFSASPAYAAYLEHTLAPHAEAAKNGCTVLLRAADEAHKPLLQKLLPKAAFSADPEIRYGGAKVIVGRVLYDETLDERLREQREAFLARCNLHVDAARLERADETK